MSGIGKKMNPLNNPHLQGLSLNMCSYCSVRRRLSYKNVNYWINVDVHSRHGPELPDMVDHFIIKWENFLSNALYNSIVLEHTLYRPTFHTIETVRNALNSLNAYIRQLGYTLEYDSDQASYNSAIHGPARAMDEVGSGHVDGVVAAVLDGAEDGVGARPVYGVVAGAPDGAEHGVGAGARVQPQPFSLPSIREGGSSSRAVRPRLQ